VTLRSRLLSWFPALHLAGLVAAAGWLLAAPGAGAAAALALWTYALPVAAFRVLHRMAPLVEGVSRLDGPRFSPWWGGHQLQALFLAWPALEAILRLVPGLFSLWLRAWGSHVGRGVYWTPRLEVTDRSLLDVGDGVIVGQGVGLYAHVVTPRPDGLLLFVRRITIGAGAFVGAGARIGPGVRVDPGAVVPLLTDLRVNRRVEANLPTMTPAGPPAIGLAAEPAGGLPGGPSHAEHPEPRRRGADRAVARAHQAPG
jgi:hypothetical protein